MSHVPQFMNQGSTGGSPVLPTSGLILHLDAQDTNSIYTDAGSTNPSTDGETIQEWHSQVGSHVMHQTTNNEKPLWYDTTDAHASMAGFNHIYFDGTNDFLELETWVSAFELDEVSVFIVMVPFTDGDTYPQFFGFGPSVNDMYGLYMASSQTEYEFTHHDWISDYVNEAATGGTTGKIISMRGDVSGGSTALTIQQEDATESTDIASSSSPTWTSAAGILGGRPNAGTSNMDFSCFEFLIYNEKVSDTKRDEILDYLNDKYSVY